MEVNLLAVLISGVVYMIIGTFWYSPVLFAKPWMKELGLTKDKMNKNKDKMMPLMGASFISSLVTAYILGWILNMLNIQTIDGAVQVAFLLWVGFTGVVSLSTYLFEGRSTKLFLINYGYHLVTMLAMGVIMAMWG
jgi:hypothetical protein